MSRRPLPGRLRRIILFAAALLLALLFASRLLP